MHFNMEQWIHLVRRELHKMKGRMVLLFTFIALTFLAAGIYWPKRYEAAVTISVGEKNIIAPLMEGTAVPTQVGNYADNAREVILNRQVLEQVLEYAGWEVSTMGPFAKERLIEEVSSRTEVTNLGPDLLRISFVDPDPQRSFKAAERFATLFMEGSLEAKRNESREAFEFVEKQVGEYHEKLVDAEERLKEFRGSNADAGPGSQTDVEARITQLRQQIEQTRLHLSEAEEKERSLTSQLSGEAVFSEQLTREQQFRERIVELQNQRDNLLLSYLENHPDVIRLNHQLEELEVALVAEGERREQIVAALRSGDQSVDATAIQRNPLYQELRRQLADTRTLVATLETRRQINEGFLSEALARSIRIANSEAELAELTRDYEVNRDVYRDLLRRRENARVSMNLDKEGQGLTFGIQEPATLPINAKGLRLIHFAAAGMMLGLGMPLAMIALLIQVDPRIRIGDALRHDLHLKVLATVPNLKSPRQRAASRLANFGLFLVLFAVFAIYGYVGYLKYVHLL